MAKKSKSSEGKKTKKGRRKKSKGFAAIGTSGLIDIGLGVLSFAVTAVGVPFALEQFGQADEGVAAYAGRIGVGTTATLITAHVAPQHAKAVAGGATIATLLKGFQD